MHESTQVALVIVDHGSRSEVSNTSLDEVVREVAARSGGRYVVVLPAHMDLAAPSIADAIDAAVAAGATAVVVALYFLAPGRHSESDVPRLVAEAAARHPGLRCAVAASLGPDPLLAGLVLERAQTALNAAEAGSPSLRSAREP